MRYYALTLQNAQGQTLAIGTNGFTSGASGQPTFSSLTTGQNGQSINNPAALNIEFDIPVAPYATPQGLISMRLWGIGIAQIAQSANLNPNPAAGVQGASFTLAGGMSAGLPLANPAQAGVLAQGSVFQAFGNWQSVNQTLELIVQPGVLAPKGGIQFSWAPNAPLSAALASAFAQAFPTYKASINISASLVQTISSTAVTAHYDSLSKLADYILQTTQTLGTQVTGNDQYPGVSIVINGTTINAYDGTATSTPIALAFEDLIGQPTWIGSNTVNFKTVMRADIQLGDQVTFPKGIISPYVLTTSAAAVPGAPARSSSVFQGTFLVQEVHHFGNFRQADADSWTTAFSAAATGI